MLHVAFYVITALGIPFLLGYPVVCALRIKPGLSRAIMATLVGLAIVIVVLRSLQYLFPVAVVAWWVLAAIAVLGVLLWLRTSSPARLLQDVRVVGQGNILTIVALGLSVLVLLNIPTVLFNARSFEGTPNHDSFFYVVIAKFMISHSFYDKIPLSPAHPIFSFMPSVFGWGAPLGRVGAEGYLAWLSILFRKDPVFLYNSLSTAGAILLGFTSVLLFEMHPVQAKSRNKKTSLLVLVAFLSPPIFTCVFNSNYSTIFGTTFFAAYMVTSLVGNRSSRRVLPILFCAALIAIYPELVPIAWTCQAFTVILRWIGRHLSLHEAFRKSVELLTNAIAGMILFPWTTLSAWFVARSSFSVADGPTATYTYPHLPGDLATRVVAFVTTNNTFATNIPYEVALALFAALAFVFVRSIFLGVRRGSTVTASVIVFAIMSAWLFGHHYSYGLLKVAEYFSPFIVPALANGQFVGINLNEHRLSKYGMAFPSIFVVLAFTWAIFVLVRTSITWGERKRITPSILSLAEAIHSLPDNALLTFGPLPWGYYYTMWLPYLSNRTFLFSEEYNGGYLAPYVKSHPFASNSKATYVVQSSDSWIAAPFPAEEVVQFGRFRLLHGPDAVHATTSGLYPVEGDSVWMGDSLNIHIDEPAASRVFLNIYFAGRFHPIGPSEPVTVKAGDRICTIEVGTHGYGLSLRVDGRTHQEITISPDHKGESPRSLGISIDSRILTYRITQLGFSYSPKHKLISCPF